MAEKPFSPKQFLKMRRPERFSDTVSQDVPSLDRSLLEYHLDTLTNRSEELVFEDFAKALLERTVCPNLLPHTGPSGGGDSKVDSETFPVAKALALSWYVGDPDAAAKERWAFAFSAKKRWRPKVESDIAKLVGTGRGYTKAFFVSNQYIRDKVRAEVEDALRKKHGVDVRIFDRTWILDQVFTNDLASLAVDRLNIKTSVRREVQKGPRDTARQQEFEAVEEKIQSALREDRRSPNLVDNCLLAADLARGMERPRQEVEGLYARADRLAKQCGSPHQQLLCAYERAWTTYWWYEDYRAYIDLYDDVEQRAAGSRNAYELELWTNAFSCLRVIAAHDEWKDKVDLGKRASVLLGSLAQLAQEEERPSACLHARTISLQVQLLVAAGDQHEHLLDELRGVVHDAEGLIGYPFEPLAEIVAEIGKLFGELPAYQKLFETIVEASTRRVGDLSAARLMLARGAQQLDTGHPYDAIRMFGRAMGRLFKHESRDDAVRALYLCSHAYEQVGLLWAARGTMLAASSIATNEFWTYENLTPHQAACYNRMKWVELRLGRVGPALAWHDLDRVVRSALLDHGYASEWLTKDDLFDPILGMLLLRADVWELRDLTPLPDILEAVGLPFAAVALLYALGHDDRVPSELTGKDGDSESKLGFFKMWRDQPAAEDLPPKPLLDIGQTVVLESSIAGCKVRMTCRNESPCVELGESLLACLEALLATAIADHVVAREPSVEVKVRLSDFAEEPFVFDTSDVDGMPQVEVRCRSFSPNKLTLDEQGRLKGRLFEVVAHIVARAFVLENPESLLTKLFRDDLAPQRALDFTTSFVVVGNVLGHDAKTSLDRWTEESTTDYPLLRDKAWDDADRRAIATSVRPEMKGMPAPADSEGPMEMRDFNRVTHKQIQTVSLIREVLWNEAGWRGTVFATSPDPSVPPILALLFGNPEAAIKIFKAWRKELGEVDERNLLRLAILRKINRAKPHWYRILVGTEPTSCFGQPGADRIVMVSRMHTMTPDSGENLERFLTTFDATGEYILTHARVQEEQIQLAARDRIQKRQIVVRDAWEIGPHDPDSVGIHPDDNPIIPEGVDHPPVAKTMERMDRFH